MRSKWLAVVVALWAVGCSNEVEDPDMPSNREGRAPWMLWGQSTAFPVLGGIPGAIPRNVAQLAQVRYGRPDSWRFLLRAKVVQVNGSAGAANFILNWNLTLGLGRGVITIPAFCTMTWTPAEFVTNGSDKYATSSEIISTRAPDGTGPFLFNEFPAESIQLDVDASFDAANTVALGSNLEISAFFAPVTHIRPEWQVHQFSGGEHKGL